MQGGEQEIKGVQELKGLDWAKKRDWRAVGLVSEPNRYGSSEPNRFNIGYIKASAGFFAIFSQPFSFFSLSRERGSAFSLESGPVTTFFFGGTASSDAVAGEPSRRRHRTGVKRVRFLQVLFAMKIGCSCAVFFAGSFCHENFPSCRGIFFSPLCVCCSLFYKPGRRHGVC